MTYSCTIDGDAVTIHLDSLVITETLNGRNTASFQVLSLDGSYRVPERAEVSLTINSVLRFAGRVHTVDEAGFGNVGGAAIVQTVRCVDNNVLLSWRQVAVTLPAGTLKSQATALAAYLTDYGVTVDPSMPTGPSLDALPLERGSLLSHYQKLALIAEGVSGTGVYFDIGYDLVLRMQAAGTTNAPADLTATASIADGDVQVQPSEAPYFNRAIVQFSEAARSAYAFLSGTGNFADTETVAVAGRTYTFQSTLTDVNGNVQIGADLEESLANLEAAITLGAGAGTAYAASMTVHGSVTAVYQTASSLRVSALSAGASGNSLTVATTAANASWLTEGGGATSTLLFGADESLTNTAQADDVAEQDSGANLVEAVFSHPEVFDAAVAQALATGYLARGVAAPDMRRISYRTRTDGLHPGQKQTTTLTARGVSADCLITEVVLTVQGHLVWFAVRSVATLSIPPSVADQWAGFGSGSVGSVAAAVTGGGGGGAITGSGSTGSVAAWVSATVLGDFTPAALTKVDDTNVTLTLGGSPSSALLAATSITAGWSGQLSIARGGTGASSPSAARTALGLEIGADVQAYSEALQSIAGLTTGADKMIYTSAANTYAVATLSAYARTLLDDADAATAASTLGLGTASSPQFAAINLGHATDTTLTRVSAGVIAVEGNTVAMLGAAQTFTATNTMSNSSVVQASPFTNTPVKVVGSGGNNTGYAGIAYRTSVTSDNYGWTAGAVRGSDVDQGAFEWRFHVDSAAGNARMTLSHLGDLTVTGLMQTTRTSEQMRLRYDSSNYFSTTVASDGHVTLNAVGSGAGFTFADQVHPSLSVIPTTNYTSNLGSLSKKYLTLHAAELVVETLVAQDVMATIGGRIVVAPTTTLTADMPDTDAAFYVKHNNLASGDRVRMESDGKIEWIAITSGPTYINATLGYQYSITRNLDGTGANQWYAGDAVLNTGTTGDGFIDLYSVAGVLSGYGPTIVGNVRTGTTYSDIAARWAIGNLNGVYGYVADTYGAAFGDPSNAWIKIDATNGVRIGHNATTKISLTAAGDASFAGAITATSGTIGSFTIGTYLYSGSKTAWNDTNDGVHIGSDGIGIGNNVFTVNGSTGALTATSATITGAITATSGTITGDFTIGTSGVLRSGATDFSTGTGWILDYNSGTPRFRVGTASGNRLAWESGELLVQMGTVSITGDGIYVQPANDAISLEDQQPYGYSFGAYDWGMFAFNGDGPLALSLQVYNHVNEGSFNTATTAISAATDNGAAALTLTAPGTGGAISTAALTAGQVTVEGGVVLETELTPTQLSANTNDWAPSGVNTCRYIRAGASSAVDLTGITSSGWASGQEVVLWNGSANTITLKHESASSSAANRFLCPGAVDLALAQYKAVVLRKDATSGRIVVIG